MGCETGVDVTIEVNFAEIPVNVFRKHGRIVDYGFNKDDFSVSLKFEDGKKMKIYPIKIDEATKTRTDRGDKWCESFSVIPCDRFCNWDENCYGYACSGTNGYDEDINEADHCIDEYVEKAKKERKFGVYLIIENISWWGCTDSGPYESYSYIIISQPPNIRSILF